MKEKRTKLSNSSNIFESNIIQRNKSKNKEKSNKHSEKKMHKML